MPVDLRFGEIFDDGAQLDAAEPMKREADGGDVWRTTAEFAPDIFVLAVLAYDLRFDCESPIEVQLGAQLRLRLPPGFSVMPQYQWKGWRMDFAITDATGKVVGFVECDGAEFHQTPDQIANDRRKDMAAKAAGIQMFRFTGSDIFNHASACARLIWDVLQR